MSWLPRALSRVRWCHRRILLLVMVVITTDLLFRRFSRQREPRPTPPLDWGSGISVVIPERGDAVLLGNCLTAVTSAASRVDEPVEIIVVVNGSDRAHYASLVERFPGVHWLHFPDALGFTRAVLEGLSLARHGATYLLNNDMLLEREALAAAMEWRNPRVFGVATQIFMDEGRGRREETGWTAMPFEGARPRPHHQIPGDDTVRGTAWAGAGAALFNTSLLRKLMPDCLPYDPFYWEDADLGARAWRMGYQSLFCPQSRAWHGHRLTVNRFFAQDEVARIFERNRLQFTLRNPFPRRGLKGTLQEVARCDQRSATEIGGFNACVRLLKTRWSAYRAPYRELEYASMPMRRLSEPVRPCLLVVSPFAIIPPRHGGAMRTHRLAGALASDYEVMLLTDEAELYGDLEPDAIDPFSVVHFTRGRPVLDRDCSRIDRIKAHSHRALRYQLARLVELYRPAAVVVEHVELAGLIKSAPKGPRYLLSLQDVLLCPGDPKQERSDRFELDLIDRFDGVIVSSAEDQRLLGDRCSKLVVNGFDSEVVDRYIPSRDKRAILFVGPFRAPNNWDGIVAFAERAYPAIEARVPGVSLIVVGGPGAVKKAGNVPSLTRSSIMVLEQVDDIHRLLEDAAITINPQAQLRGSSLKVIESLAAGRVCVSTVAGARGHEQPGFRGLVVVPAIDDFVEPIIRLLRQEHERIALEPPEPSKLASYTWDHSGRIMSAYVARAA